VHPSITAPVAQFVENLVDGVLGALSESFNGIAIPDGSHHGRRRYGK